MEENNQSCNFLYSDVVDASTLYNPLPLRIRRWVRWESYRINQIIHPKGTKKEEMTGTSENEVLNLQPGELVEVRSIDEISATLDENGKYKGLYFMPEMENFCGKKFKVFKKVEIIKLESTGEVRKLRSPSVFLEGVYCNGERHYGCDRSCFHFWREIWLKRIPDVKKVE